MIVLPHTPPTPLPLSSSASLEPKIFSARALIATHAPQSFSDSVRYLAQLEQYIDTLFSVLALDSKLELAQLAQNASETVLSLTVPWDNVSFPKSTPWTLATEIQTLIIAASLLYARLGADVTNELIEENESNKETDEKWKAVANHYKKGMSLAEFGAKFAFAVTGATVSPALFVIVQKVNEIGLQSSTLCKFSWMNRRSYNETGTFTTANNGVLCRVAIWVLNEVEACSNLVQEVSKLSEFLELNYTGWQTYLLIFKKYMSAYAGYFLSVEYYQKKDIGRAIGLVNYSLLSLQSRSLSNQKIQKRKVLARVKLKLAAKRNEHYVSSLQSITLLNVDKSVFSELSGVVLNDLTLLFDQLMQCHLMYTKENDNLHFDHVVDWQDIQADSKWPIGSKIPVSDISPYTPSIFQGKSNDQRSTQYY